MMTKEVEWQHRICAYFKRHGGYASKWASEWQAGKPDLIIIYERKTFFVEVKRVSGVKDGFKKTVGPTVIQRKELKEINEAGGIGLVLVVVEWSRFIKRKPHIWVSERVLDVSAPVVVACEDLDSRGIWGVGTKFPELLMERA